MKMQFKELNSLIYVLKTFITAVHFLSYIFVKCNRIEAICAVFINISAGIQTNNFDVKIRAFGHHYDVVLIRNFRIRATGHEVMMSQARIYGVNYSEETHTDIYQR